MEAPTGYGKTLGFTVYASRKAVSDSILYLSPYHSSLTEVAANLFLLGRSFAYFTGMTAPGELAWCPKIQESEEPPFFHEYAVGLPISYGCLYRCGHGRNLRDVLTYYYRYVKRIGWLGDELDGDPEHGRHIYSKIANSSTIIPRVRLEAIRRKVEELESRPIFPLFAFKELLESIEERTSTECIAPVLSTFPNLLRGKVVLVTHAYASTPSKLISLLTSLREESPPVLILDEFDNFFLEPDFLPDIPPEIGDWIDAEASFLEELASRKPSVLSTRSGEKYLESIDALKDYLLKVKSHPYIEKLTDIEGMAEERLAKGQVRVILNYSQVPVLDAKLLRALRLLLLVGEIHDMYFEHLSRGRARSAISLLSAAFGSSNWPPPDKLGVKEYSRVYFFRFDDRERRRGERRLKLATYELKPHLLLSDYPVRKKLILLSATTVKEIEGQLPFAVPKEGIDLVRLYGDLTGKLWERLFSERFDWEMPPGKVEVIPMPELSPFEYQNAFDFFYVLGDYITVIESYLSMRPYDKLILCQNKSIADLVYDRLYSKLYLPEDKKLWYLSNTVAKRVGVSRIGTDYFYGLMKDARHPKGYKQVFITWFRSRITRGIRLNAFIDTVIIVGSPYPPPTTLSPYQSYDFQGKSHILGTAASLKYGDRYLVHTVADVFKAVNDLIQALARPLRVLDSLASSEILSRDYHDFSLQIVMPYHLFKKVYTFAPHWLRKFFTTS